MKKVAPKFVKSAMLNVQNAVFMIHVLNVHLALIGKMKQTSVFVSQLILKIMEPAQVKLFY